MRTERLNVYIGQTRFFQTNVTTRAAVDHSEIGQPNLLNSSLKMTLQCNRIAAVANQF